MIFYDIKSIFLNVFARNKVFRKIIYQFFTVGILRVRIRLTACLNFKIVGSKVNCCCTSVANGDPNRIKNGTFLVK